MKTNGAKNIFYELLRFVLVGGIAFIVDISVLYVCKEYVLKNIDYTLYISTVLGFVAGIIVNYALSISFVFREAKDANLGRRAEDKLMFIIIGLIGIGVNELGMYFGVELLAFNYLMVKIFTTTIVMFWNYLARKKLIFQLKYSN